eukprot:CAMPEP_0184494656 /NCGR_PEP_ID=MMETSP0113_2-20130426/29285_1 /TAXON_ID=91329 /ORGANISM="Norrisiella sphaerica, Strain BC52" /LENGTH=525 /DNA_ID=CAMNT_0026880507 /DNA_START=1 /DNA_END=1578 /DNA_ORIENTATION=+
MPNTVNGTAKMSLEQLAEQLELSLSLEQVQNTAKEGKYNVVPIFAEMVADVDTPVTVYLKLSKSKGPKFLFESVAGGENIARYSFIGVNPYKIMEFGAENKVDPLRVLEKELKKINLMPNDKIPDFTGGAVGYVGYDCVRFFEPTVEVPKEKSLDIPDCIFSLYSTVVCIDRVNHTMKIIYNIPLYRLNDYEEASGKGVNIQSLYEEAAHEIESIRRLLENPIPKREVPKNEKESKPGPKMEDMKSNVGQKGYEGFVETLKKHIRCGDIIQAVPSQRLMCPLNGVTAFDLYRQLRMINPSPYMFFMDYDTFQIVGASPELLVKCVNGTVTTHPIAGTRKRGKTKEEDDALATELLANEKERAEHIMLVDLGRNDVGRVAEAGTVKVDSLMHIEKYSHVMHIVSHVSGKLAKDKTMYDAFRSVFPAGTVSGAPKVRAMQLVNGLEPQSRGVYSGAVGHFSFSGNMDTCIAIRTLAVKDGVAHLQAGGGIVFDSEPTPEYEETMNKMRALGKAIQQAERMVRKRKLR